jgi:acyl-CoA reductase-like NAD-dependent aldehyde dehydrogenase
MSTTPADGSATDQAKQGAQQATEQVKDKAREGAQQARDRARDEVDRRSTEAGEQVSATADAIRQASSHLREQGQDTPARLVEQAAGHVERAGGWLQESDGDRILNDVEDLARRNPLAVIAGGVVVGFALSRVLKASSRDRHGRGPGSPSRQLPARTMTRDAGVGTTAPPPTFDPATRPPTVDPATRPRI